MHFQIFYVEKVTYYIWFPENRNKNNGEKECLSSNFLRCKIKIGLNRARIYGWHSHSEVLVFLLQIIPKTPNSIRKHTIILYIQVTMVLMNASICFLVSESMTCSERYKEDVQDKNQADHDRAQGHKAPEEDKTITDRRVCVHCASH